MACKYPGLISVVLPMGLSLLWLWHIPPQTIDQTTAQPSQTGFRVFGPLLLIFSLGVVLAIGPWLLKNLAQTGNPVYPLGYTIFGGADWSPELNQKWRTGHSSKPSDYTLAWFATNLMDVTLKSDWQSPLLFSLAPLVLLLTRARRVAIFLWGMILWQFLTWWWLTHRIDRFWVPLIPIVALLAGAGFAWSKHLLWRSSVILLLIGISLYHFVFISSRLCGYNAYLLDLERTRHSTLQITSPEIEYLHQYLPPHSKVLFVGEAELFDANFPYEYNTVFDFSLFEQWTSQPDPKKNAANLEFRPITHICVNWQEVLRYRNTYTYTNFVTRERFLTLQKLGILGTPLPGTGRQLFNRLSPTDQKQIQTWSPALMFKESGEPLIYTFEVFPVKP